MPQDPKQPIDLKAHVARLQALLARFKKVLTT